jgi:hypothetical protein
VDPLLNINTVMVLAAVGFLALALAKKTWKAPMSGADRALARFKHAAERETRYLMKRIPDELATQNRHQHEVATKLGRKGERKVRRVILRDALITSNEVFFPLNSRDFPYGMGYHHITDEKQNAIKNLQLGIHRAVRTTIDKRYQLYLVCGFRHSFGGLPVYVPWSDHEEALAAVGPFHVPLGINEGREMVTADLTDSQYPHYLVMGATGAGKTTFMRQAFVTLLMRNRPDQLRFVLLDLKGVDFIQFREVPHVDRYVDRPDMAIDALEYAVDQMYARLDVIKGEAYDINGFNKKNPQDPIHRLFVWCDEIARVTQAADKEIRKQGLAYILEIASMGRAAGVHLMIGTQQANKESLTMPVVNNISGRVCFSMRSTAASILAIENGAAVGLYPSGRCAIPQASETLFLQSPIAHDEQIETAVRKALSGDYDEVSTVPAAVPAEKVKLETIEDILRFAHERTEDRLNANELYEASDRAMPEKKIRKQLQDNEGKIFLIDDRYGTIAPSEKEYISGRLYTYPRFIMWIQDGLQEGGQNGRQATTERQTDPTERLALDGGQNGEEETIVVGEAHE